MMLPPQPDGAADVAGGAADAALFEDFLGGGQLLLGGGGLAGAGAAEHVFGGAGGLAGAAEHVFGGGVFEQSAGAGGGAAADEMLCDGSGMLHDFMPFSQHGSGGWGFA